jgi:DNA-binding XRE family transcriptional regulator
MSKALGNSVRRASTSYTRCRGLWRIKTVVISVRSQMTPPQIFQISYRPPGPLCCRIDSEVNQKEVMRLIGDRVREHRKRKGLSQEQLGAMVGFSQSKISKIENGNCDSLSDLKLIARALGVRIEELVKEEPDCRALSEEQDK